MNSHVPDRSQDTVRPPQANSKNGNKECRRVVECDLLEKQPGSEQHTRNKCSAPGDATCCSEAKAKAGPIVLEVPVVDEQQGGQPPERHHRGHAGKGRLPLGAEATHGTERTRKVHQQVREDDRCPHEKAAPYTLMPSALMQLKALRDNRVANATEKV
mmetsp:Transcript_85372/g.236579  ORF Transcript_85372/g.236579 Transcript_85372/m.236579 type:complete len:158 (-) Transcript_85372:493-966(-)